MVSAPAPASTCASRTLRRTALTWRRCPRRRLYGHALPVSAAIKYVSNLGTKNLKVGDYYIIAQLGDGASIVKTVVRE